jgi:hypothetical protein
MKVIATALVFLGLAVPSYGASSAGPGASSCLEFALDDTRNLPTEEQYFIWAQGYMSAVVMMVRGSIDAGLDFLQPHTQRIARWHGSAVFALKTR